MGLLSGLMPSFSGGSGIGNSQSQQQNSSETTDMSVVGAEGSINSSIKQTVSGSNNVITTTDHGAVSGALALAMRGVEGWQKTAQDAISGSNDLMAGIFDDNAKQAANLTQAVVDLKTSDVRTLVIAGMAVIGLVGVTLLRNKKVA
ncbi:hypothetical protein ACQ86G_21500 [Roseateles chitinivorans]|uniref:hypothetical protein n=1 Tax=Roseateles chitinivorans TaxID=2917965 RepID=UPI003D66C992